MRLFMRIAICDDEQNYRNLITKYIRFYFQEHLLDLKYDEFNMMNSAAEKNYYYRIKNLI